MIDRYTNDPYADTAPRVLDLSQFGAERFTGQPPEVDWLVRDTIPLKAPAVIAAPGDTGKGYKILEIPSELRCPPSRSRSKAATR
jgi:hypothetical protein